MILLQHGTCGLNRSPGEHGGFKIVSEGSGVAILAPGIGVEFEDQGDEESQDEECEEQSNTTFVISSDRTKDTGVVSALHRESPATSRTVKIWHRTRCGASRPG
jgi:hypothetical protein